MMTREEMDYIPFAYDDGGRTTAGFRGSTGDCAVRAVAIATGMPYGEVYRAINDIAGSERLRKGYRRRSSARTGVHTPTFKRYIEDVLGWVWIPTMQIGSGCRVHVRADELPDGRLILNLSRHFAAVVDGVLRDTYDCSRNGTRCVYGYWTPPSPPSKAD